MTCKTSCSNYAIFKKTVARFWPLWLGYLIVWLLTMPLSVSSALRNIARFETITAITAAQNVYATARIAVPMLSFFIAPLSAMAVFSHLYNDKSCGAYASLPVTRTSMFWQTTLAGIVPLFLVSIITALITAAAEASLGVVHWSSLFAFLGYDALNLLAFYGFAVLCAQLTGVLLVVPAVYAVLQFAALGYHLATAVFPLFLYGSVSIGNFPTFLAPLVQIMVKGGYHAITDAASNVIGFRFGYWHGCGIYAAVGIALTVLAWLLYRSRKMETVGDWVAVKPLKTVFRWCMALGCSILLTLIVYGFVSLQGGTLFGLSPFFAVLLPALLGGFIGWYGSEMLMQKSFRVFGNTGWHFAIYAAVLILALSAVRFDVFGYTTRIPNVDTVQSVSVSCRAETATLEERDDIVKVLTAHNLIIQNRDANQNRYQPYNCYVSVDYTLKNGRHLTRAYDLYGSEENAATFGAIEDIMNTQTALMQRRTVVELTRYPIYACEIHRSDDWSDEHVVQIDSKEATALFNDCILPDILDGTMEHFSVEDVYVSSKNYSVYLEFMTLESGTDFTRWCYIQPTPSAVRTCAWLEEHGFTLTETDDYGVPTTEFAVPEKVIS